jgi:hypothetical protein
MPKKRSSICIVCGTAIFKGGMRCRPCEEQRRRGERRGPHRGGKPRGRAADTDRSKRLARICKALRERGRQARTLRSLRVRDATYEDMADLVHIGAVYVDGFDKRTDMPKYRLVPC